MTSVSRLRPGDILNLMNATVPVNISDDPPQTAVVTSITDPDPQDENWMSFSLMGGITVRCLREGEVEVINHQPWFSSARVKAVLEELARMSIAEEDGAGERHELVRVLLGELGTLLDEHADDTGDAHRQALLRIASRAVAFVAYSDGAAEEFGEYSVLNE